MGAGRSLENVPMRELLWSSGDEEAWDRHILSESGAPISVATTLTAKMRNSLLTVAAFC